MRHGGKLEHERGGAEIINRGVFGLRACGLHRHFKHGNGKLPIGLTQGDQSNSGGYQIGEPTLQESGQREVSRNSLPSQCSSENDRESRLDSALADCF